MPINMAKIRRKNFQRRFFSYGFMLWVAKLQQQNGKNVKPLCFSKKLKPIIHESQALNRRSKRINE